MLSFLRWTRDGVGETHIGVDWRRDGGAITDRRTRGISAPRPPCASTFHPHTHGKSENFRIASVDVPSWFHGGPRQETHADTPGRRSSLARSVLLSPRFGWEKKWIPSHSTFGFLLLPLDARIPSSIKHLRNTFICMVSKTGPIVRHPSLVLMELLGDTCSLNSLPSQRPCLWLVSSSPKVILEGTVSWPTLLPMACTISFERL